MLHMATCDYEMRVYLTFIPSLQLYNFGETVSLVMWSDGWQPDSYVDKIDRNLLHGNHTLCLLGIAIT